MIIVGHTFTVFLLGFPTSNSYFPSRIWRYSCSSLTCRRVLHRTTYTWPGKHTHVIGPKICGSEGLWFLCWTPKPQTRAKVTWFHPLTSYMLLGMMRQQNFIDNHERLWRMRPLKDPGFPWVKPKQLLFTHRLKGWDAAQEDIEDDPRLHLDNLVVGSQLSSGFWSAVMLLGQYLIFGTCSFHILPSYRVHSMYFIHLHPSSSFTFANQLRIRTYPPASHNRHSWSQNYCAAAARDQSMIHSAAHVCGVWMGLTHSHPFSCILIHFPHPI